MIDTSPTPSLLHSTVYLATDFAIYPTLCEYWSMDGLAESMEHRKGFERYRNVQVGGIVPIRVRGTTLEHRQNLERMQERFGDHVWTPIPESIVWPESTGFKLPVQVYAPDHDAARYAWGMVEHVEAL